MKAKSCLPRSHGGGGGGGCGRGVDSIIAANSFQIATLALQQSVTQTITVVKPKKAVPSARHGSAGELVHNNNLLPPGDVVDILDLQLLGLQGIDQVAGPLLPGIIQIRTLHPHDNIACSQQK